MEEQVFVKFYDQTSLINNWQGNKKWKLIN